MTQAQYSTVSKGAYAKAETRTIHSGGLPSRRFTGMYSESGTAYDKKLGPALFKIRTFGYCPLRVVVITDKPRKPVTFGAVETPTLVEV